MEGMTRGDGSFVRCRRRKSIKMGSNITWNWMLVMREW
jgi:hypothetical protein